MDTIVNNIIIENNTQDDVASRFDIYEKELQKALSAVTAEE